MTEEQRAEDKKGSILVVGGGISGLTATLEAAEVFANLILYRMCCPIGLICLISPIS